MYQWKEQEKLCNVTGRYLGQLRKSTFNSFLITSVTKAKPPNYLKKGVKRNKTYLAHMLLNLIRIKYPTKRKKYNSPINPKFKNGGL